MKLSYIQYNETRLNRKGETLVKTKDPYKGETLVKTKDPYIWSNGRFLIVTGRLQRAYN
jgi:hypothetical protein